MITNFWSNVGEMTAEARKKIIRMFQENVEGKVPDPEMVRHHHGGEGHWLELQMGLNPNARNEPDIFFAGGGDDGGYEMKCHTGSKTTFGDWQADFYIYFRRGHDCRFPEFERDDFLQTFGKKSERKEGRYSWSGEPAPKIHSFNDYGQKLEVNRDDNILALYSYSEDKRENKSSIISYNKMKIENLVLARWDHNTLKQKLEKKFNQHGWFKCLKDSSNIYRGIIFGPPMNYELFISYVKTGDIYFDSGMYSGNPRPYAMWRADNRFWDSMVIERYP